MRSGQGGPGSERQGVAEGRGASPPCLFIPALAFGLGTLSASPRLFEVVYLLLWYIGPMNHVATLDFTGMAPASRAAGYPWTYLAFSTLLFATATAARSRQTNR